MNRVKNSESQEGAKSRSLLWRPQGEVVAQAGKGQQSFLEELILEQS